MLNIINRTAVIITPKQTFFDMVAKISGEQPEKAAPLLTTDESTIYLIEDSDYEGPYYTERMASCYKDIFFEELDGWFPDTDRWPKSITWEEFTSYFHISYQSMIFDTCNEEIEYE